MNGPTTEDATWDLVATLILRAEQRIADEAAVAKKTKPVTSDRAS